MNTPEPGFRPDDHSNWLDRIPRRQRDISGALLIVVLLFGWAWLFSFALPEESWQEMYATPVFMAVAVLGFRWTPKRGELSTTLRARRARAWVAVAGLVAVVPFLAWANFQFDGFVIGMFMLMVGVLVERWGLGEFKWRDLFGDSEDQQANVAARD